MTAKKKRIDVNSETWQAIEEFLNHRQESLHDDLASDSSDWNSVLKQRGELRLVQDMLKLPEQQEIFNQSPDYD